MDELLERCDKSMFVTLTAEMVHAGKSRQGGWSREQLELLGVDWPPVEGWIGRACSRRWPGTTVATFLRLKDKHLPADVADLFTDLGGEG